MLDHVAADADCGHHACCKREARKPSPSAGAPAPRDGRPPDGVTYRRDDSRPVCRRRAFIVDGYDLALPKPREILRSLLVLGLAHDGLLERDALSSLSRRLKSSFLPRTRRDWAAATDAPVIIAISARSCPRPSCKKSVSA